MLNRRLLLELAKHYRSLGYNLGIVSPTTKALVPKTRFYQVIPSISVTDDSVTILTKEDSDLKALFLTLEKQVHHG